MELVPPSLPLQGAPHAQAAGRCGGGAGHGHVHPLGGAVPGQGGGGGVQGGLPAGHLGRYFCQFLHGLQSEVLPWAGPRVLWKNGLWVGHRVIEVFQEVIESISGVHRPLLVFPASSGIWVLLFHVG